MDNKLSIKDGFKFGIGLMLATALFYFVAAIILSIIGVGLL